MSNMFCNKLTPLHENGRMRVFLAVSGLLEAFARDSNDNELDQENVHRSQFQTKQTSLQKPRYLFSYLY